MRVTDLTKSDVNLGETRQRLGERLTLDARTRFATEMKVQKGNPYQTKYWDHEVVVAACQRFTVEPVLTQQGKDRAKKAGGLVYDKPVTQPPAPKPVQDKMQENRQKLEALKPRPAPTTPQPEPDVTDLATPQATLTLEQRRAALTAVIDERIAASRSVATEETRSLITSIASASAGAAVSMVLENEGKRLVEDARRQVTEMIEAARPIIHHFQFGDAPPVVIDGPVHECFDEVVELAMAREEIALIGPTGSGKTHIARQVAIALGFDPETQFAAISCSGGMSESKIIGGLLPTGEGGKFEPFWTDFLRLFRDGGLFLADEWDGADENVALVVNSALSNGYIDIMGLGRIYRHRDFVMIVAMNTFGTGANRMYVGRNQMDEATLDRFRMGQIEMDYDREMERHLVQTMQGSLTWLQACWQVRDAINTQKLRRNMSTRFILKGVKMQAVAKWSHEKCMGKLVKGWSQDEKQKAGLGHL